MEQLIFFVGFPIAGFAAQFLLMRFTQLRGMNDHYTVDKRCNSLSASVAKNRAAGNNAEGSAVKHG